LKRRAVRYTLIRKYLKSNRSSFFYVCILGVLLFFPFIMSPIFKQVFTDSILVSNMSELLGPLLLLMGGAAAFSALLVWLQKNCLLRLSNKIELSGAASYMWRLFHAPIELFRNKDSFVLVSGAGASAFISKTICFDIFSMFSAAISVLFYFTMMFRMDRIMSLIVLALIALSMLLGKLQKYLLTLGSSAPGEKLSSRDLVLRDERISSQGIQNIETFKATASETHFFQQIMGSKIRIIKAGLKGNENEAFSPFNDFPRVFFLNILLFVSALRIMNREFTFGSYLAFQAYASAFFYPMLFSSPLPFFSPLRQILSAPGILANLEERLQRLSLELGTGKTDAGKDPGGDAPPAKAASAGSPRKLQGYIEFKDVSFSDDEGVPILEHFSLSLKPGQRAALVGNLRCGKSSVIKLLQGIYTPSSGEITIDGLPVSQIDRKTFMASIGCANQEIHFFTASIRDNITLWDDDVSDGEVYRALSEVRLHSHIASLEGAYDHILEEHGRTLSEGQRRRIEIARALLYDPSIITMDEVMSAVGAGMAKEIEKNLKRRGCTILQATNILSAITDYDEIILLDRGRVIARGTHQRLLANSSWYADLFRNGETA
jgi:ABC-type bacteriocin/lantibiotic exporter with double-glycine peptidase domain